MAQVQNLDTYVGDNMPDRSATGSGLILDGGSDSLWWLKCGFSGHQYSFWLQQAPGMRFGHSIAFEDQNQEAVTLRLPAGRLGRDGNLQLTATKNFILVYVGNRLYAVEYQRYDR